MQTNIRRKWGPALVLAPEDLHAIESLLAEHYKLITFSASCSDGSILSSNSLVEILGFENPSFRRIESLSINAAGASREGCLISFDVRFDTTCDYSITDHDDKRALKIADELGKRFHECRPFYSFLARIAPSYVMLFLWGMSAIVTAWNHVIKTGRPSADSGLSLETFNFFLPFLILFLLLIFYLDRGWKWMFPKLWFLIGRQARAFETRANVRYWVFGSVILGIVLCVIGNLITYRITKN